MSDQAPPGWWQAADGRWYPPDQHPGYAAPPAGQQWAPLDAPPSTPPTGPPGPPQFGPPGPPQLGPPGPPQYGPPPAFPFPPAPAPAPTRPGQRALVVVLVVAAIVIVGAIAFVTVGTSSTHSTTSGSARSASGSAATAGFVELVDTDGEFKISFPTDWVTAETKGDVSKLGETMVPNDPTVAQHIDSFVNGALPRDTVLIGFVRSDLEQRRAFTTNMNLIPTDLPSGTSLDEVLASGQQTIANLGGTVQTSDSIRLPNGPAKRVRYRLDGPGVDGVQYYEVVAGRAWVITFSTTDFSALSDEFDQVAQTFVVTP